ncbi:NAD(P)/FAD-dependent oxidoreductase [Spirosoma validum]|uniref:FAD-dependent oxidoreductase n=1 Tax=Spirosoma validum TaxID=2771355 RepID=A0A927GFB8_9BACT|nr:FAD-dependent oxidoreductase [Spirosoma validum]MBD2755591.1 FAD-dependent oxidoreductase [Spirosoma validum]
MICDTDILIIGGGLAGLTAGIHLAQHNLRVTIIEKHTYPHHKVCGEYVSNEVLPYLQQLGIDVDALNPSRIHRFLFSTVSGKTIESELPLGGFGLSRYTFDELLYQRALLAGVHFCQDQVIDTQFQNDAFIVKTAEEKIYTAPFVIGAYGKRSVLDKQLHRDFFAKESPWIGVKAHYQASFPDDLVSLHNFEGGYCGLCQVENNVVNACYLASYESFKKHKNVVTFQEQIMSQNPFLKDFFTKAIPLFDKPLTISQISFAQKRPVEQHILMCGDTAGVIHPLCGNGMAMAIHSAKLASELIIGFFQSEPKSRSQLENAYTIAWNAQFKKRLAMGRFIQSLLQSPTIASVLINSLRFVPGALPVLIKQTHGKPLVVNHAVS